MTAASNSEASHPMSDLDLPDMHIALDGENEPTLWLRRPANPFGDKALVRKCDIDLDAWCVLVAAVEAHETASHPIPAPVDSGAIGRLNDDEADRVLEAVWSWEEADEGVMAEEVVLPVVDAILCEHTDRALAEVHDLIDHQAINVGDALAIVRAARQEQGR